MFRRKIEKPKYIEINLIGMNFSVSIFSEGETLESLRDVAKEMFIFVREGN